MDGAGINWTITGDNFEYSYSIQQNFFMVMNNGYNEFNGDGSIKRYGRTFCYVSPNGTFAAEVDQNDNTHAPSLSLTNGNLPSKVDGAWRITDRTTTVGWGIQIKPGRQVDPGTGGWSTNTYNGYLDFYPSEFDTRFFISKDYPSQTLKDVYMSEIVSIPNLAVGRDNNKIANMVDGQYCFYVNGNNSYIRTLECNKLTYQTLSDIKLKTVSNKPNDYVSIIKSLGDVVTYRYKSDKEFETLNLDTENEHTGLIYQNAKKAGIKDFTGEKQDGTGWINYISPDYQATLLGAVQQLIKRVEELENKLNVKE